MGNVDQTQNQTQNQGEEPIKVIQKLTGKLTQKMRDSAELLDNKQFKYIINSVISAINLEKLSDEDKTEIINKLQGGEDNVDESETDEFPEKSSLLQNTLVSHLIDFAGLDVEMEENPRELEFDIAEALYVYRIDYNDDTDFIHNIGFLLRQASFKPGIGLKEYNDLDRNAKIFYKALAIYDKEHSGAQDNLKKVDHELLVHEDDINESIVKFRKLIKEIKKKIGS